ncbi:MAG TPA: LysM peptidoglycan-binding domain-containing protein [Bacteroidia bacterium]|nr:LysM peptidoglycan-binding domain-containing protein [Bacteroidia bacterium]
MHRIQHLLQWIFACTAALAMLLPFCAGATGPDREDSLSFYNYSLLSRQFVYQADTSFRVNEPEVRAGLLYDVVNKKIVWQKNMGSAYPIASLTKMMVALLAVEDVRSGKISWEDNVHWVRETVTGRKHKRKKVYTSVNYTLRDVFKAAMIASNNECAEQMARYISCGDLKASIDRMNRRAKELGMTNTFYGNPTGLPARYASLDNSSTPTDQLTLSLELLKYDEVLEIAGMGYASIDNGKSTSVIRNHNKLTIEYSGEVDGLKTGYTRRAGFCLVATVNKCEHRLISVVFGCRGPQIRNEVVRDMFSDYYSTIALDRLGPFGSSPLPSVAAKLNVESVSGEYATVVEKVRKTHVVRKGETLSQIASKYDCTVGQLRAWNKKALKQKYPMSGQRLSVYTTVCHKVFIRKPANGTEEEDDKPILSEDEKEMLSQAVPEEYGSQTAGNAVVPATTKPAQAVQPPVLVPVIDDRFVYHTIAPGDTLFSIAKKYEGATVEQIKSINKISNIRGLKPGMKIKVPVQG